MKFMKQFGIILFITFLGEVLKYFLPLPIPASIYGLVILFIALELRIVKIESVREVSKFLIEIMPMLFIPAGVGLIESWGVLKPILMQVTVIVVVSTIVVMAAAGRVTQLVIRIQKKKSNSGKLVKNNE